MLSAQSTRVAFALYMARRGPKQVMLTKISNHWTYGLFGEISLSNFASNFYTLRVRLTGSGTSFLFRADCIYKHFCLYSKM